MSKKVNFAMVNDVAKNRLQDTMDTIFVHAVEANALTKAMRNARAIIKAAVDAYENGGEAELRAEIEKTPEQFDAKVINAFADVKRIDYKRSVLSKWYKSKMADAADFFNLDLIIEELGATDLEQGVRAIDAHLTTAFGLDAVAKSTRYKFARAVYSAVDGKRKSTNKQTAKGTLLSERSRAELREIGIRAMCQYAGRTSDITIPVADDYKVVVEYNADLTEIRAYTMTEI